MKKLLLALFLLNIITTQAQKYPEVTISGSEIRTIKSSIVKDQEYKLHISLPGSYKNTTKKYPVVFLMDSQWDFPLVSSIYGEQYYDGFIPEVIIVGVTWGGKNPNPDVLRARDYTPTDDKRNVETGGANNFLDFMKTELFPFLENNYRVKSDDRTLVGCSLGGLFTLYTLFTHTDMFTNYVAASPAVGWDNGVLYQFEKEFSKKKITKQKRVYMTVGDVELSKSYYQKFAKNMVDNNYNNVLLHSKVLENTGHSGTKSETYTRGLQYAFKRNELKLSDTELQKFTGTYKYENGNTFKIIDKNNELTLVFSPRYSIKLFANTKTHFYATFSFFNIHFKEQNGKVKGFDLMEYGNTKSLIKVK